MGGWRTAPRLVRTGFYGDDPRTVPKDGEDFSPLIPKRILINHVIHVLRIDQILAALGQLDSIVSELNSVERNVEVRVREIVAERAARLREELLSKVREVVNRYRESVVGEAVKALDEARARAEEARRRVLENYAARRDEVISEVVKALA